jgi:hypothetical protein
MASSTRKSISGKKASASARSNVGGFTDAAAPKTRVRGATKGAAIGQAAKAVSGRGKPGTTAQSTMVKKVKPAGRKMPSTQSKVSGAPKKAKGSPTKLRTR